MVCPDQDRYVKMTADMMQNTAIKTGQWTAGIRMAGQYPVF